MSKKETLHMKVGSLLGEHLLEIAQTEISKGNIEFGLSRYTKGLVGFTNEYALMCLKNEAVLVTSEDGTGVNLVTDKKEIKKNAHNIFDWYRIISKKIDDLYGLCENIINTESNFIKYYKGNILDYSMLDMMKRYYNDEEMKVMSGTANIAARICGHPECKICDKGSSNPYDKWTKIEGRCESYLADIENYGESDMSYPPAKWELVLYLTVRYNKLIRMLHNEYVSFDPLYYFLVENSFIDKVKLIELTMERVLDILVKFADTSYGYYHPLCNVGLYEYKEKLYEDIIKTRSGKEFCQNGILKKDIMDGYDAGWLSPEGEYYGGNGETSSMIHLNIAEQIFKGNNVYAVRMMNDGVQSWGGTDSPDYWLEKHGWVKIHHNDCYGAFIGRRNEEPTPDYPYAYNPTDVQIKMICDYADKFYGGKFYTEANAFGRDIHPDPYTTYAVRQMDEFKIHEIFGR